MKIQKTIQTGGLVFAVLIFLTSSSIAGWGADWGAGWGQAHAFYPGGHMMATGYMNWVMIFFWIMLLVILLFVVRYVMRLTQLKNIEQSPLEILKHRLANGEIDIEEFKAKKQFL